MRGFRFMFWTLRPISGTLNVEQIKDNLKEHKIEVNAIWCQDWHAFAFYDINNDEEKPVGVYP